MTGWLDGVVAAALIVGGSLGARWAGWRWHGWRLRRVHAQHAGPAEVAEAGDAYSRAFYGAMTLDDERAWGERGAANYEDDEDAAEVFRLFDQAPHFLTAPPGPDWREQTMAELGALGADPGPGVEAVVPVDPPPGPDHLHNGSCGGGRCWDGCYRPPYHDQLLADTEAWLSAPTRLAHTGDIYGARLDLGPRAAAVLERYEQRRQERWALA